MLTLIDLLSARAVLQHVRTRERGKRGQWWHDDWFDWPRKLRHLGMGFNDAVSYVNETDGITRVSLIVAQFHRPLF